MKYRVEVHTVSCQPGAYTGNGIEHDTQEKAREAAVDLSTRWTAVEYWRVIDEDGAIVDTNQPGLRAIMGVDPRPDVIREG